MMQRSLLWICKLENGGEMGNDKIDDGRRQLCISIVNDKISTQAFNIPSLHYVRSSVMTKFCEDKNTRYLQKCKSSFFAT